MRTAPFWTTTLVFLLAQNFNYFPEARAIFCKSGREGNTDLCLSSHYVKIEDGNISKVSLNMEMPNAYIYDHASANTGDGGRSRY